MAGDSTRGRYGLSSTSVSALSGAGAGALTTTVCSPLDVVKTRMQVQDAIVKAHQRAPSGFVPFLMGIYREEGVRGWFRGYQSAMLTVPLFWGVYFPCYRAAKQFLLPRCEERHKPLAHMGAAVLGGFITDVATNPLWVVRTRLVSQHLHVKYSGEAPQYTGTFQTMRLVVAQEGFRGLYKGITASFLGLSHVAVQFPLYEALKAVFADGGDGSASSTGVLVASTTSKLVASTLTYPHEVVRAQMQDQRSKNGSGSLLGALRQILRGEGLSGMYRGLGVNLIRVVPSTAVTFVTYEQLNNYLMTVPPTTGVGST
jgi:solute carrier family 25 folate transporter 32